MKYRRHIGFTFAALSFCLAIGVGQGSAQTVNVWLTTDNQKTTLRQQPSISFSAGSSPGANTIFVDETQTYQIIEGFGASFTDSAAYLLNQKVPASQQSTVMSSLFDRGAGIGISFVRNPMGASDLSRSIFSYDDLTAGQADPGLTSFSISHDMADIVPLVKIARQINPQLKIMANPWSPPGWMKTTGSMIGGSLLPAMYGTFANYFVNTSRLIPTRGYLSTISRYRTSRSTCRRIIRACRWMPRPRLSS
jgi:glucosylceramidase